MKKGHIILIIILIIAGISQEFRPEKLSNAPMRPLKNVPEDVAAILQNSCYDCHSSQINLHWYDQLTPANFFVSDHIQTGRKALNFSNWDTLPPTQQRTILYYGLNKIIKNEMPLSSYTMIHSGAKISNVQLDILKNFALSLSMRNPSDNSLTIQQIKQFAAFQHPKKVADAPNGIPYLGNYRDWKIISISDRFEQGTLRMIFINKIGEDAIRNRQTNPWPDGTILAKAKWKQIVQPNGSVTTGPFWQVEIMIKDRKKYASTDGWGWARWLDEDLKPYGKNALFTTECQSCHQSTKNNDFVFAKPLDLHF
ncbi:MAG: heme-binding domain-containing protein [Arachidicoccus sp.]|nr:heme-binding domain-containing protein [Arachidicoccus sp.]